MKESIISVGIDLGTSTMQIIFSKLCIENLASSYSIPKISITDKKIIYKSKIVFTPIIDDNKIDLTKVKSFIEKEYRLAKINYKDVKTGALIITGETARKENADKALEVLSNIAGEFVVATAGPLLESTLSGLGAKADIISKENRVTITNIDIGGGTSNISYFENGDIKGVTCLDIGGRLIKVDTITNKITYIYHKIKKLAKINGIEINVGDDIDINKINRITEVMGDIILQAINLKERCEQFNFFITNDEKPLDIEYKPEGVSFSGGVGHCIYNDEITNDIFKYGDVGILLARNILNNKILKEVRVFKPQETLSATVIGAGMYSTEISGSTICIDNNELPLKNIPIVKIKDDEIKNITKIIREKINIYLGKREKYDENNIAIAFPGYIDVSFKEIQNLSNKIIKGVEELVKSELPIIVLTENDIGKALGNALLSNLGGYKKILCIDKINVKNGDYIDIGSAIANEQVVPVIVKTLVLNS